MGAADGPSFGTAAVLQFIAAFLVNRVFVFSPLSANIMNAAVNLVICNHYIASVDHAKLYFINSDYTTVYPTHFDPSSSPTAYIMLNFLSG